MEQSSNNPQPTNIRKATPAEKSWREYALKAQQDAPEHFESAAKFLTGLVSVCLTLFLKINDASFESMSAWVGIAVVLWLLSVVFAFFVFFPFGYGYSKHSSQSIEAANQKVVQTKRRVLMVSTVFFLAGLFILGGVFLQALWF